jgi:hypothetical protein
MAASMIIKIYYIIKMHLQQLRILRHLQDIITSSSSNITQVA